MKSAPKYYARSSLVSSCLLWATLGTGCAGPNARHLGYADLKSEPRAALDKLTHLPAIVAFKRGERVPVELAVDSSLIELVSGTLELVAKRDFYLLLRPDGPPLLSEDGVDFEQGDGPKNYFFFGFGVQRGAEPSVKATIGIRPEPQAPK